MCCLLVVLVVLVEIFQPLEIFERHHLNGKMGDSLRESMDAAIRKAFTECQQSAAAHSSWNLTLQKYLTKANADGSFEDGFLAPFWSCLDHVVSVFKRQPKVDRLLKFVANLATWYGLRMIMHTADTSLPF